MADPIVLTIIGQAVVIIGMLVKMLRDDHVGGKRVEAATEEHTRLEKEIAASEARGVERGKAVEEELDRMRERVHSNNELAHAVTTRQAVIEERTKNIADRFGGLERSQATITEKVDKLLERLGAR